MSKILTSIFQDFKIGMQINCYSLCGNGFISREKNAISFDDRPEYLKVGRGSEKNIIVSNQCFLNMCRKVGVRAIWDKLLNLFLLMASLREDFKKKKSVKWVTLVISFFDPPTQWKEWHKKEWQKALRVATPLPYLKSDKWRF